GPRDPALGAAHDGGLGPAGAQRDVVHARGGGGHAVGCAAAAGVLEDDVHQLGRKRGAVGRVAVEVLGDVVGGGRALAVADIGFADALGRPHIAAGAAGVAGGGEGL